MQKSQYVCGVNLNTEIMKKLIKKRNINFLILIMLSFMALSCEPTKKYYSADFEKLNHKIDGEFYNYQSNNFLKNPSNTKISDLFNNRFKFNSHIH
jgi:hypothetical protein